MCEVSLTWKHERNLFDIWGNLLKCSWKYEVNMCELWGHSKRFIQLFGTLEAIWGCLRWIFKSCHSFPLFFKKIRRFKEVDDCVVKVEVAYVLFEEIKRYLAVQRMMYTILVYAEVLVLFNLYNISWGGGGGSHITLIWTYSNVSLIAESKRSKVLGPAAAAAP